MSVCVLFFVWICLFVCSVVFSSFVYYFIHKYWVGTMCSASLRCGHISRFHLILNTYFVVVVVVVAVLSPILVKIFFAWNNQFKLVCTSNLDDFAILRAIAYLHLIYMKVLLFVGLIMIDIENRILMRTFIFQMNWLDVCQSDVYASMKCVCVFVYA